MAALALAAALAQQPPAQRPPAQPATAAQPPAASGGSVTFQANANLVIVDVTAKDKSGRPVEGLRAEDFTVLEDGKPQKISVFEYETISTTPEPPPEITLDEQLQLPEAPKTTITSTTPGKVQYHDKRLMVFFFDFSSMADSRPVASAGRGARLPQ